MGPAWGALRPGGGNSAHRCLTKFSPGQRDTRALLHTGGAWHEIELWISLQVTRYLEDASVAAAAGASAAPPVDMLLQLVNRLVSEEHGAATRLKGVFQRQWGRLAQILPKLSPPVSAGAIATTRSVLKLLSATYTPEVSAPPGARRTNHGILVCPGPVHGPPRLAHVPAACQGAR